MRRECVLRDAAPCGHAVMRCVVDRFSILGVGLIDSPTSVYAMTASNALFQTSAIVVDAIQTLHRGVCPGPLLANCVHCAAEFPVASSVYDTVHVHCTP